MHAFIQSMKENNLKIVSWDDQKGKRGKASKNDIYIIGVFLRTLNRDIRPKPLLRHRAAGRDRSKEDPPNFPPKSTKAANISSLPNTYQVNISSHLRTCNNNNDNVWRNRSRFFRCLMAPSKTH